MSTAHLLLGMSYFATLIYTAFRTRPAPSAIELDRHEKLRAELGSARTWIAIACGAVFVQLLLGALVRHLGAAMVCLGMPTCTMRRRLVARRRRPAPAHDPSRLWRASSRS